MKLIQTHKYTRIHCRQVTKQVLYFFKSISHPFLSSSENIIIHLYIKNTKQMIKKITTSIHEHTHTYTQNQQTNIILLCLLHLRSFLTFQLSKWNKKTNKMEKYIKKMMGNKNE